MRIGVVGSEGVVGKAISAGFERLGHKVLRHDLVLGTKISDVYDTDIVFICVPTPMSPDGSCNTSIVAEVFFRLADLNYGGIVAIKSTVIPGTTQQLIEDADKKSFSNRVAFVPEFLRERSAFHDFTEGHDICVIGTHSDYAWDAIVEAHGDYPQRFFRMTPTEAELVKYFNNLYGAMKVTFANAMFDVCESVGANYSKVKQAIVNRPTVEDSYLDCNDNFRGYAGACYSKDVPAFAKFAEDLGVEANIFKVIRDDNKLYKPTVFEGMRA